MSKIKVKEKCQCGSIYHHKKPKYSFQYGGVDAPVQLKDPFDRHNLIVEVDKCIVPLIKKLWRRSIRTKFCCCGHANQDLNIIKALDPRVPIPAHVISNAWLRVEYRGYVMLNPQASIEDLRTAYKIISNFFPEYKVKTVCNFDLSPYTNKSLYDLGNITITWDASTRDFVDFDSWMRLEGIIKHTVSATNPEKVYQYLVQHNILDEVISLRNKLIESTSEMKNALIRSMVLEKALRYHC